MASQSYLDPSTALEHLKSYTRSDGLSVSELMDSQVHGGLTYNDFLVLPGKIDFAAHAEMLGHAVQLVGWQCVLASDGGQQVQLEDAPLAGLRAQEVLKPLMLRRTKNSELVRFVYKIVPVPLSHSLW